MVGLPGVGKTTWTRHYLKSHPDEKWSVIGAEPALELMKVRAPLLTVAFSRFFHRFIYLSR